MTTDFRALCAELADSIELLLEMRPADAKPLRITEERLSRSRAALAEPQPEGPTDEELESFLVDVACQNGDMYYADPRVLARAVLARWGNS